MEVTPVLKGWFPYNQSDHYNPSDHWNFSMTGEMVFLELSGIVGKLRQGSKFKFEFWSTCATRCKFLGALPKF